MLDADWALEFAGSASGALEDGLLRIVFAEQQFFCCGAKFVEVAANSEDDLLWIENLAGVGCGAVLGSASAFDTGVGLQAHQLGQIFAGDEAEVFIT